MLGRVLFHPGCVEIYLTNLYNGYTILSALFLILTEPTSQIVNLILDRGTAKGKKVK